MFPFYVVSNILKYFPPAAQDSNLVCVGRGGLVNPVGLELRANRRPPAARHLDCVSSTQRHCVSATDKSELAGPGTLEYCF